MTTLPAALRTTLDFAARRLPLPASGAAVLLMGLATVAVADGPPATLPDPDPACEYNEAMALEDRASPLMSFRQTLGEGDLVLCWGAPSARGRIMIGGEHVPFGELWRMGANEPTVLHTEVSLSVGGVRLEPGSYALYAIPGENRWEVFISASTDHWGNQINEDVRAAEVGTIEVEPGPADGHVEILTFRLEDPGTRSATLVMEWESTRLEIPVTATGG
ncbi:MAG: DUF2911 domain-containing protein [Gemmatimonadales bacterium]|nr:MAG: DUF2911 domain-containing protein [Gemmatimonadales bacterium]